MATTPISPAAAATAVTAGSALFPEEVVVASADGVRLGWQWRTVLIWWVPGLVFIALGQLQFHSLVVSLGLFAFCLAMFAFYSSDSEVRPRARRKRYVLTGERLLIGAVDHEVAWRPVVLAEVAATRMEKGLMDRAVARLSGAATIVLEMRDPGPKGEPRRVRIGPMRQPDAFRRAIEARLTAPPAASEL